MAKQQTDDELNIRRKQRRRLVGAVTLTLAIVVILPMVLDSEPKPAQVDIDLQIPDPDRAGEFIPNVEIPESSAVVPQSDAGVAPPTSPEAAPTLAQVTPAATAAGEATPSKNTTDKASAAAPTTAPKPTTPKPAEKPASVTDTGYVAQVGAYANADAAKQELAKLKQWGFSKAYIEKAGDKTRVRVGPYPSREKAESVGGMLEKRGLHPVILSAK